MITRDPPRPTSDAVGPAPSRALLLWLRVCDRFRRWLERIDGGPW